MNRQRRNRASHMQRRRMSAQRSLVHGKGLFALRPITAGERLIEVTGERTSWRRVAARQRADAGHTFVFVSGGRGIVGSRSGNSARYLNYACAPNCEAIESCDRVFIHALADIAPGSEFFIDYALAIDGEATGEIRQQYACCCNAPGADEPCSARQIVDVDPKRTMRLLDRGHSIGGRLNSVLIPYRAESVRNMSAWMSAIRTLAIRVVSYISLRLRSTSRLDRQLIRFDPTKQMLARSVAVVHVGPTGRRLLQYRYSIVFDQIGASRANIIRGVI
jgi:uncharacterized protein